MHQRHLGLRRTRTEKAPIHSASGDCVRRTRRCTPGCTSLRLPASGWEGHWSNAAGSAKWTNPLYTRLFAGVGNMFV